MKEEGPFRIIVNSDVQENLEWEKSTQLDCVYREPYLQELRSQHCRSCRSLNQFVAADPGGKSRRSLKHRLAGCQLADQGMSCHLEGSLTGRRSHPVLADHSFVDLDNQRNCHRLNSSQQRQKSLKSCLKVRNITHLRRNRQSCQRQERQGCYQLQQRARPGCSLCNIGPYT